MSENDDANVAITNRQVDLPEWRPQTVRPVVEAESLEVYSSLRTYRDILVKHFWLIFGTAFALTAVVATYSVVTKPEYRATARILVEQDSTEVRTPEEIFRSASPNDENFLMTQVNLLQSDNLAWQTIEHLQLSQVPEFAKHFEASKARSVPPIGIKTELLELFRGRLIVDRRKDTRMIEVSFNSHDPELSARIVNTLVNKYIEYNFRMKYDAAQQTNGWMEQQLHELKNKVEHSQQALIDYERQNSIVSIGGKQSVGEQKLEDLSRNLTQAQSARIENQSIFELASSTKSQVGAVAQNEAVQRLEGRDADLREQYAEALAQYGETYPKVERLRAQIDELQRLIEQARRRIIKRLHDDLDASKAREALLTAAVAKQKAEVGNFNELLIEHNILKHEFETNQQLYETLLQRLKSTTLSAGLRATNIHLVDEAIATPFPVSPRKFRNSGIGLLAGLILGFLAAMVRETLDNSIRSAEEVEKLIAAPALAIIPSQNGVRLDTYASRYLRFAAEAKVPEGGHPFFKKRQFQRVELSVLQNPSSPISESFRALRTSMLLSTRVYAPQTILVTSAEPHEGKTCVSLNLAFSFAQKGCRVLLIDADFRRPGIVSVLGLSNDVGLHTVLTTSTTILDKILEKCIRQLGNLWVLPAGPCPPNPTELLSSDCMGHLLRMVRQQFDQIIIDSPAVLRITDATILSSMVDGVVIVVEDEKTGRGALLRACRILTNSGGRILGAVLNKVDVRRDGYYGHYY